MAEEFQAALFVYDEGLLGGDREAQDFKCQFRLGVANSGSMCQNFTPYFEKMSF
jgi:hypothetical protein